MPQPSGENDVQASDNWPSHSALAFPTHGLVTEKQPPGEAGWAEDLLPTGDSHCLGDPERDM